MSNATTLLLTATLLLSAGPPSAWPKEAVSSGWRFPVEEYRLNNGLRVILSADETLPLVSVVLAYGAGSIREQQGQAGLAYLMENLMFQGSENIGPLQHLSYIQRTGGIVNADTTLDKAVYYQALPSNQLALALWLESDRMRSLQITAGSLEKRREEILAEHRRRLATEPYLESYSVFDTSLYPDFPYGHPLIGAGGDLEGLTEADIKAFYAGFYIPNNAVLTIVGDIQIARTKELVAKYFDPIPPGSAVSPPPRPNFEQHREVVQMMQDASLPSPGFHLGYRLFPPQTGDTYALKILEYLLFRGRTSRLYTRIMKRDLTAYYFWGGLEDRGGVPALKIFALNTTDVMAERCQRALLSEFEKLKVGLVSEDELNKARRLFKLDYLQRLSTGLDRALYLVDAAFADIPLQALPSELEKYMKVSSQSLNLLVNRLFVPGNKVVLNIRVR
jgi:predicted Zn-dependent peptidase